MALNLTRIVFSSNQSWVCPAGIRHVRVYSLDSNDQELGVGLVLSVTPGVSYPIVFANSVPSFGNHSLEASGVSVIVEYID